MEGPNMPSAKRKRRCLLDYGGVIGIDPGKTGGISYVVDQDASFWALSKLTDRDTWELIKRLERVASFCVLERVWGRPMGGSSGMFNFGMSYGELKAWVIASGIRFETVIPATWQKRLGCLTKGDKNVTKTKAQELFPGVKVTHAVADSLLIAEYGRRFLK